jgi:sRNA-binding carbon storage regulator CsrA
MSQLCFKEGDYVLIGETIKLHFDYKTGRNSLLIAIDAPADIPIHRRRAYEQSVAEQAMLGDDKALLLSAKLSKQSDKARRASYASRARRDEQERRMAAGEIKRYNA